MSVDLVNTVLRSQVPARLRLLLVVLAFRAHNDGTHLWIGIERLGVELGVHRATASRLLAEAERLGFIRTVRRGGRWRTVKGRLLGRHADRVLDVARIEAYRPGLDLTAWSNDQRDRLTALSNDRRDRLTTWSNENPDKDQIDRRSREKDRSRQKDCRKDVDVGYAAADSLANVDMLFPPKAKSATTAKKERTK